MERELMCRTNEDCLFNFNAEHNGVQCIESTRPEDRGTEHQYWFTRQMLRELFDVKSDNTITNHVDILVNRGVLDVVKNLTTSPIINSNGAAHETMLYDLKVFNLLVMRLDTDRAWNMKEKFNDVLVKAETQPKTQFSLPTTYIEALEALLASEKEKQRALEERDEARRTKTLYQEGLASQMSGRVGGLQKANNGLRKENADLKDAVGRGCNWRTISMMRDEWIKNFGHAPVWQKLKQFSEDVKIPPVQDVEEKIVLKNGSEKTNVSYRYHKEAWARYKKYEENLRVSNDEVESV